MRDKTKLLTDKNTSFLLIFLLCCGGDFNAYFVIWRMKKHGFSLKSRCRCFDTGGVSETLFKPRKKDEKNAGKRSRRGSEQLLPNIARYGNNRLRGGIRGMCQGEEKGEKGRHRRRSLISQRGRKAKEHFTPWGSRKHR